jgi:hypothetical protein
MPSGIEVGAIDGVTIVCLEDAKFELCSARPGYFLRDVYVIFFQAIQEHVGMAP